MPRALDLADQIALARSVRARDAAGDDLAALGHEIAEPADVLEINRPDLFRRELADLFADEFLLGRALGFLFELLFFEHQNSYVFVIARRVAPKQSRLDPSSALLNFH